MTRVWREHDVDTIFRRGHRFIDGNEPDAIGVFPILKYKPDYSFDLIFLKKGAGVITEFSGIHQNDFAMIYLHKRFSGLDFDYNGEKFLTGFPIHEFRGTNAGVMLLRHEAVEVFHIRRGDMNITLPHAITHWPDLVHALVNIDTYALENQYVGGFIDCHYHHDYHRLFLFKQEYFYRKSIPEWRLNHLTNFRYNFTNPDHIAPVRKAHNYICSIIDNNSCSVLTEDNKQKLKNIYFERIIHHHEEHLPNPSWDAMASIHGNSITFRPNFLPATPYSLTGLVFHEMMHNLGYDHPDNQHHPDYKISINERVRSCVPTTIALAGENLEQEFNCKVVR